MAILYKAKCCKCSEVTEYSWGHGIFHLQYQCCSCLKLFLLPRKAPRPNRNGLEVPKFLEKNNYKSFPPTQKEKIIRFSDIEIDTYLKNRIQWQYGDDDWDEHEILRLTKQVASCGCGVTLMLVDQQKQLECACRNCGSKNLKVDAIGIAD